MATRKTLLRSSAGVRLERVERLSAQGKLQTQHFVLKTMRPNQPRVISDEDLAGEAFDLEVVASLMDPVVARLVADH